MGGARSRRTGARIISSGDRGGSLMLSSLRCVSGSRVRERPGEGPSQVRELRRPPQVVRVPRWSEGRRPRFGGC